MSLSARLTIAKCRTMSSKPDAAAAADEALKHQQTPPRPFFKGLLGSKLPRDQERVGVLQGPVTEAPNPVLPRSISVSSSIADNAAGSAGSDLYRLHNSQGGSSTRTPVASHAASALAAVHGTSAAGHVAEIDAALAADPMDHDADGDDLISSEESEQLSGESDMSSDGYNTEDEEEENNSCCMIEDELHQRSAPTEAANVHAGLQAAAAAVAPHSTPVPGTLFHHLSSSLSGCQQPEQQQQHQHQHQHQQEACKLQQLSDDGRAAISVAAAWLSAHNSARVCLPVTPPPSPAVDTADLQQQSSAAAAAAAMASGLPAPQLALQTTQAVQAVHPVVIRSTIHLASPLATSRRGSTPSGRRGSTPGSWSQGLGRRAWAWLSGDVLGSPTATIPVTATPPPSPAVLLQQPL